MPLKQKGFTIVELLIVIVVIGILAAITIVAYNGAQNRARVATAASDLRSIKVVLAQYYAANGALPCFDHSWDDTAEKNWSKPNMQWPLNPWGNHYHWEHSQQGLTYSISIESPGQANAQALDNAIDDGNLLTGVIRGDGTRLEYGGMDQSIPLVDCHI
jgi:type II secretion system protein G